ncbi:LysR substrate-binding domain-containing protein [Burkholderia sp. S171]|uniref:LysR substrate-binding domain-containing protein n=1 Tax=Burkholderia sp. S171 TaxID=1641860 RepID=UPI00131EA60B|nr:LysR substrate-binding domain-containing protein [Burkholderia sp. S171]
MDLVVALGNGARGDAERLGVLPLAWTGPVSTERVWAPGEPISLVMYRTPCFFRQRALAALDDAGVPWRIAFTSPSLHGLWAAVEAGLGVTLRTTAGLPNSLRTVGDAMGLPAVAPPTLSVSLHDGGRPLQPAVMRLREVVIETLTASLRDLVASTST